MENLSSQVSIKKRKLSSRVSLTQRIEEYRLDWVIKNFSFYRESPISKKFAAISNVWEVKCTSPFWTGELEPQRASWQVVVCPCKTFESEDYVGIYLQKISGDDELEVHFEMSAFDHNDVKCFVRKGEYRFRKATLLGWDDFIPWKSLMDWGLGLLTGNALKLHCEMQIVYQLQTTRDSGDPDKKSESLPDSAEDKKSNFDHSEIPDVLLISGNVEYTVHGHLLSAASPVFAAMLKDEAGNYNGVLQLNDVDDTVVEQMLTFVYQDEITEELPEVLLDLYVAAEKYKLPRLVEKCARLLVVNLDAEHVLQVATLAFSRNDERLLDAARNFVRFRVDDVTNTREWEELEQKNPVLAVHLAMDDLDRLPERVPGQIAEQRDAGPIALQWVGQTALPEEEDEQTGDDSSEDSNLMPVAPVGTFSPRSVSNIRNPFELLRRQES